MSISELFPYSNQNINQKASPHNYISTKADTLNLYRKNPVLNNHRKLDKTNVLKRNGSLMKVERIAECCTFDLH